MGVTDRKAEQETLLEDTLIDEKGPLFSIQAEEEKASWRNLPHKRQLLLLALCRLSTPLSNACLLPYLYFLVKSILSDPEHPAAPQQISRLTGLLVAAYPLGQMSTSMLWGRVSDLYGRKPVILFGLAISVVANLAFGFSRTIGTLVFWRVVAGMANGILGVMRTMTAEIVKERKHQPRAFLAAPVIFNSGRVVALAVGGCLADPVDNLPAIFGPEGLFNVSRNPNGVKWALKYPYALPAVFNGAVLALCLVLATLWLRESLSTKENHQDFGLALGEALSSFIKRSVLRKPASGYAMIQMDEMEPAISGVSIASPSTGSTSPINYTCRPLLRDIWSGRLLKVLLLFALLPLHTATFLHVFPVFLSMPTMAKPSPSIFHFTGGLGLASPTVGLYLATFGIAGILLQLFIYPRIQSRIGTLGVFRLASFIFPLAYIFAPYVALLSGYGIAKYIAMAAVLFTQIIARTMAIPSSVILLTEAVPHRRVLGTVHGAGNTLSAFSSACGPAIGGLLLAKGIEMDAVGLVWWAWLCTVSIVTLSWSLVLGNTHRRSDETCGND
ncbi:MFS general substrate transporter [Cucurbitaria berberidis CBS 394.84]|uniref:MFS general substrate transporter n=1 Tax=Cucurbitaria berberidis CBS 394.84 TaxID=1168544 RepID=A0A9P4GNR7_9PLEO|nr:MFS general substrate transporter [Cucurbitaria berberidis CBS 394.84]KAF1849047.1 MFS general substrate transporter [Cucurbitaria berberidis CBS 394.84]